MNIRDEHDRLQSLPTEHLEADLGVSAEKFRREALIERILMRDFGMQTAEEFFRQLWYQDVTDEL
jgi:hypothetical protein